jgi:DNA-directed RNA polymerase specialized sigma24 family protein
MAILCEQRRSVRRAVVTELWLQGVNYAHIARVLGCTLSTVRRDIAAACVALQLDYLATLNQRLARSPVVSRLVQQRA